MKCKKKRGGGGLARRDRTACGGVRKDDIFIKKSYTLLLIRWQLGRGGIGGKCSFRTSFFSLFPPFKSSQDYFCGREKEEEKK